MFKILKKSKISQARLGIIKTSHGDIETPCFMPDATRGAVKHLSASELTRLDLECLVANTFHLLLRPGVKLIKQAKGLHDFINWPKPILTDSGGYQVFSLIHRSPGSGRITDAGVIFKSPLDGAKLKLTPEQSIKIQFALAADLMVCLDDCPPNDFNQAQLETAVQRTIKWAKRCKAEFNRQLKLAANKKLRPLLFAVIQGGNNLALRKSCAKELIKIGFDGFGFGARHIDEAGRFLDQTLRHTAGQIPPNRPRFGLGIGTPEDIIKAVKLGWDMFDCVIPTREGRHGRLFLWKRNPKSQIPNPNKYEITNITNAKFAKDFSAINPDSKLEDLRKYSKAYLNYLFKIKEPLAERLASFNNLEFYLKLLADLRLGIKQNRF